MKLLFACLSFALILVLLAQFSLAQQTGKKAKSDHHNVTLNNSSSHKTSSAIRDSASSPLSSSSGTTMALNIGSLIRENAFRMVSAVTEYTSSYTKALDRLWTRVAKNDLLNSPIVLSIVGISMLSLISAVSVYIFPEIQQITDKQGLKKIGRIGRSIGEIALNMDKAIDTYSTIEPEVCIMMALCTLGSAQQNNNIKRRSRTIDTINTVLNFPGLDEVILVRKDFKDSHSFGRTGGNCELINMDRKCPLNYDTWKLLLSSLSSVV